jgi:hypothetical protein
MSETILTQEDIQVVIVHDFFDQIHDPFLSELFLKLLKLKRDGYQAKHSHRFLPVGTHDFFGIHLILCEQKTMTPILCSKIVSYKNCEYFNTPFPLQGLSTILNSEQQNELQKIISQRVDKGRDISYSGGLTINPAFKGFGLSSLFKDIYTGLHYLIHEHNQFETMMGFGTPKVGTDAFFRKWGVYPLAVNGVEMQPTPVPFANGTESLLMWADLENLSDYKKEMGVKFKDLWESRKEYLVKATLADAA